MTRNIYIALCWSYFLIYPFILDINECTKGSDNCKNARCINTQGAFNCSCNAGYKFKDGSKNECEGKWNNARLNLVKSL